MPRHIWPEDQAFLTVPPSTSTSMRRWPSMRVIGSMVIRLPMLSPPYADAVAGAGSPQGSGTS